MDQKKLGDLAGRLKGGGKGMGAGLGLLAAAGGLVYAASQSIYTGAGTSENFAKFSKTTTTAVHVFFFVICFLSVSYLCFPLLFECSNLSCGFNIEDLYLCFRHLGFQ